ncbi:MAG: Ig-like domain-containing protein [Caloramator sp.]|nr:Ig-like domain-containing protein [Caloramator sp.]
MGRKIKQSISNFFIAFIIANFILLPITVYAEDDNTIIKVSSIILSANEITLEEGQSIKIEAKIEPESASGTKLIWSSSDTSIIQVDENGNIQALKEGEAKISVMAEAGDVWAECIIKVERKKTDSEKLKNIILNTKEIVLEEGKSIKIQTRMEPENIKNIKLIWSVTNTKVVLVDGNGNVKALQVGEAKIKVAAEGSDVFAECVIKVIPKKITMQELEKRVISSAPSAVVAKKTYLYYTALGKKKCILEKGTKVNIIESNDKNWHYIRTEKNIKGWIDAKYLYISKAPVLKDRFLKEELEFYVNNKRFLSSTNYFVWVDIARQRTYIFLKNPQKKFKLIKDITVATGRDVTPTLTGFFKLNGIKGELLKMPKYKCSVRYWTLIYKNYLFHSLVYSYDGKRVLDAGLGVKKSHGCIRMNTSDAQWFYENIPPSTSVWIN